MLNTDEHFSEAVERAVAAMETDTDAEVVVVAAQRSAAYHATSLVIASVAALLGLVVVLYAPVVVPPWAVPLDVLISGGIGYGLGRTLTVLHWLTPGSVQRAQVRRAAHDEFVREAVYATPQRSGVLVYVSALERQVVLLADVGVSGQVPRADWERVRRAQRGDTLDGFVDGLTQLEAVLHQAVPHVDAPGRLSLPDAPRIRS